MSGQMLTTSETQLAWRKLSAEESLAFLLLGRSLRVAGHALVVRAVVLTVINIVTISHFNILQFLMRVHGSVVASPFH